MINTSRGAVVPNVEIKRKAVLTRQEVADRLIALGNALASGSEIELSAGGDSIKIGVAGRVHWELEIEVDGDETEIEVEIKWKDDPAEDEDEPAADATPTAEADAETEPPAKAPAARRGRPRKVPAS